LNSSLALAAKDAPESDTFVAAVPQTVPGRSASRSFASLGSWKLGSARLGSVLAGAALASVLAGGALAAIDGAAADGGVLVLDDADGLAAPPQPATRPTSIIVLATRRIVAPRMGWPSLSAPASGDRSRSGRGIIHHLCREAVLRPRMIRA
jgi:hypothetical protein